MHSKSLSEAEYLGGFLQIFITVSLSISYLSLSLSLSLKLEYHLLIHLELCLLHSIHF